MTNNTWFKAFSVFAALSSFLFSTTARAELGQPRNWQLGFQEAVTPIMRQLTDFHNFLLILITVITLFVLALLVYVALRFNENANPKPLKYRSESRYEAFARARRSQIRLRGR